MLKVLCVETLFAMIQLQGASSAEVHALSRRDITRTHVPRIFQTFLQLHVYVLRGALDLPIMKIKTVLKSKLLFSCPALNYHECAAEKEVLYLKLIHLGS